MSRTEGVDADTGTRAGPSSAAPGDSGHSPSSPEAAAAAAAAEIFSQGYHIAKGVLSPELCDELRLAIDDLEKHGQVPAWLKNPFHGHRTVRFHNLLNHGEVWARIPAHEKILPIVQAVLGEDCLLNNYMTCVIDPGETAQPIHVDDGPFIGNANSGLRKRPFEAEGKPRKSIVLQTVMALTDVTERNGATRLVPRSNTWAYPRPGDSEKWMAQSVGAVMPKGSILFFDGQTYHAGGANQTEDERRYALLVNYCAGYLRTQENFMLACGEDRAARFPQALQELIGYSVSSNGLGQVFDHDPSPMVAKVAVKQGENSVSFEKVMVKGGQKQKEAEGGEAASLPAARL